MNDTALLVYERRLTSMVEYAGRYSDSTMEQRDAYYRQCKRQLCDMALEPRQYERAIIALCDALRL